MISIGEAAWLNAAVYEGPRARLLEGWLVERHLEDLDTGTVMAHYRRGEIHYLAVRGTWSGSDIAESLRVFLGQEPTRRMRFLQDYIQDRFDPVDPRRGLVGGHSLGGLVAAGAAERWHLAGLAQNAPGWMQPRHDNSRLDRFLLEFSPHPHRPVPFGPAGADENRYAFPGLRWGHPGDPGCDFR